MQKIIHIPMMNRKYLLGHIAVRTISLGEDNDFVIGDHLLHKLRKLTVHIHRFHGT